MNAESTQRVSQFSGQTLRSKAPRRCLAILLGVVPLLFAAGCLSSRVNQFSRTATDFNVQVADAQNKTLLMNIVRAAYRFPMHFTELTTLSNTNTLTLGGTLTAPVGILNGGMGTGSVAPTGSLATTPTFNAAVLETQEFYQGMVKALSMEQVATYLNEGLPAELVLSLSIGQIIYQPAPGAEPTKIENNFHSLKGPNKKLCPWPTGRKPGAPVSEYECFRPVLRALIDVGLTTEPVKSTSNVGALVFANSFADLRWLNGLDPKAYKVVSVETDDCKAKADACPEGFDALPVEQQAALAKGQKLYRFQKETSEVRYCFNHQFEPNDSKQPPMPPQENLVARIQTAHIDDRLICRNRLTDADKKIMLKEALDAAEKEKRTKEPSPSRPPLTVGNRLGFTNMVIDRAGNVTEETFSIQAEPRSTEGVIYYLGEIARCNLTLDEQSVCTTTPVVHTDYRVGGDDDLFKLAASSIDRSSPHESKGGYIEVDWGEKRYRVDMDPKATDRSGQVLRLLTQLVALNRSAKDFPTPAIVPIISR